VFSTTSALCMRCCRGREWPVVTALTVNYSVDCFDIWVFLSLHQSRWGIVRQILPPWKGRQDLPVVVRVIANSKEVLGPFSVSGNWSRSASRYNGHTCRHASSHSLRHWTSLRRWLSLQTKEYRLKHPPQKDNNQHSLLWVTMLLPGLFGSFSWSDVRFWGRDVYVYRL